jgi:CRP-like cAMP-binding protein
MRSHAPAPAQAARAALRPDELARLQANPWFMSLPEALRGEVLSRANLRRLPAGSPVAGRSDRLGDWYGVAAGALSLGSVLADGRAFVLDLVGPGRWWGDIALVDGKPQDLDIRAQVPTTLLTVPHADMRWLMQQHPELPQALLQLHCERLRRMFRSMEELHTLPLHQRVARQLRRLARHFGRPAPGMLCIDVHLSQSDLAAMLGASRQRINACLRQLQHLGVLQAGHARLAVLDAARLEAVADGRLDPATAAA